MEEAKYSAYEQESHLDEASDKMKLNKLWIVVQTKRKFADMKNTFNNDFTSFVSNTHILAFFIVAALYK